MRKRQIRRDQTEIPESYRDITRILFFTVVPVILSSAIYNLNSVLDNGILAYNFKTLGQGDEFASIWGVYTGKYHLLINVPMAISNALSSSLIPSVSRAVAMGDKKLVRERVASAIRFSCIVAIPSTVGLTVLAVNHFLFSGDNSLAIRMTIYGSLAVVFYSVSTVTNAILQGIDKMRLPIFHAVISLVLHLIALEIMALGFHMGIYSMVFANILFALFMVLMNARSIRKLLGYRQEMKKTVIIPVIASAVMGIFTFGSYQLAHLAVKSNAISTLFAMMIAVVVYGVLLIKLGALSAAELKTMPGGTKLLRVFRKLHLM